MKFKVSPILWGASLAMTSFSLGSMWNQASMDARLDAVDLSLAKDKILKAAENKTYVMLGDTNHGDEYIDKFKSNTKLLPYLAEAGFKNIAVEELISYQPMIDALASGRINKKTFVTVYEALDRSNREFDDWMHGQASIRSHENFAEFILEAKKNGIKILAVDGLEGRSAEAKNRLIPLGQKYLDFALYIETHPRIYEPQRVDFITKEMLDYERKMITFYKAKNIEQEKECDELRKNFPNSGYGCITYVVEEDTVKILQNIKEDSHYKAMTSAKDFYDFASAFYCYWQDQIEDGKFKLSPMDEDIEVEERIERRFAEDHLVAERIKKLSGGEKTLVIYGAGHAREKNNLAKNLDAPVLEIYSYTRSTGIIVDSYDTISLGPENIGAPSP